MSVLAPIRTASLSDAPLRSAPEVGADQLAVLHDRVAEVGLHGLDAGQFRALKVGAAQIGIGRFGGAHRNFDVRQAGLFVRQGQRPFAQVGLVKVATRQVGAAQAGAAQVGAAQGAAGQVDQLQIGAEQVRAVKDCAAHVAVGQDGGGEVGVGQHPLLQAQARQVAPGKHRPRPARLHGEQAFVLQADLVDLGLIELGVAIGSRGGLH
jgi:hypothetical protein